MSALDLDLIEGRAARKIRFGGFTSEEAYGTDADASTTLALIARVREFESIIERLCGCAPDCAERITCGIVGGLGHAACGWCDKHERPRHKCGCIVTEATS